MTRSSMRLLKTMSQKKRLLINILRPMNEVRNNLNADLPDVAPRVTETMDQIIEFIDKMVKNRSMHML